MSTLLREMSANQVHTVRCFSHVWARSQVWTDFPVLVRPCGADESEGKIMNNEIFCSLNANFCRQFDTVMLSEINLLCIF